MRIVIFLLKFSKHSRLQKKINNIDWLLLEYIFRITYKLPIKAELKMIFGSARIGRICQITYRQKLN